LICDKIEGGVMVFFVEKNGGIRGCYGVFCREKWRNKKKRGREKGGSLVRS